MWRQQINDLASRYHVLAPDLRGFGDSTLDGTEPTIGDLAEDIEFVRQSLASPLPIALIGLSMGGYVALEYWRRYREHLAGLVLSNTKPETDTDEARLGRLKMADQARRDGTWAAVALMLGRLISSATAANHPSVTEFVEQMMRAVNVDTVVAAQHAMAKRLDFTGELPRIQVPTLVVTGQHDLISPPSNNQTWSNLIARAQLKIIPEAGHLPPLETPSEFTAILSNFLDSVF